MIKISDTRLAMWLDQVADGLDVGLSSGNALSLAPALPRGGTDRILEELEAGRSWSVALASPELGLSAAEMSIVQAAERSATLPGSLRSMAATRRERAQTRRRLFLAAAYPLAVLHLAAFVFAIEYLMDGNVRAFFVSAVMLIGPFWLAAGAAWLGAATFPNLSRTVARCVPIVSKFRIHEDLSTLCRVLAACLRAGMPLENSWEAAADATGNARLRTMGDEVVTAVRAGKLASGAVQRCSQGLPESFLSLYRSGENTGNLERNLDAAADRYATEAKRFLFITSMVYPKLLLFGVLAYAGYKIVVFYQAYYQRIMEMGG